MRIKELTYSERIEHKFLSLFQIDEVRRYEARHSYHNTQDELDFNQKTRLTLAKHIKELNQLVKKKENENRLNRIMELLYKILQVLSVSEKEVYDGFQVGDNECLLHIGGKTQGTFIFSEIERDFEQVGNICRIGLLRNLFAPSLLRLLLD